MQAYFIFSECANQPQKKKSLQANASDGVYISAKLGTITFRTRRKAAANSVLQKAG
jgi:hypothetical protein